MKIEKNRFIPGEIPVEVKNSSYQFILNIQSTSEMQQLWALFIWGVTEALEVKRARLIYRGGIIFECMSFDKSGVSQKPLTEFNFADFKEDFDSTFLKNKVIILKRADIFYAQMELTLGKSLQETTREAEKNELLARARIFFNQLFMVLRIKNFEYQSLKDDITLAYNQNYLKAFIQSEIERSMRYASVFSIVFFDLDNLKAINEKHGHLVGTEVLKEVAAVLRGQVRKVDLLSRFGGDEFVIVLLHADASKAYDVCSRIRTAIKSRVFLENTHINIGITGCFGISSFPDHGNTVDELIRNADLAMYDVKRSGKDGIKIYKGD